MGPYPSRLSEPGSWDAPWVILDSDVRVRIRNYRDRLKKIYVNNQFDVIVDGLRNHYVRFDLKPLLMADKDHEEVMNFLQTALETRDVTWIVKTYTAPTPFYRLINTHLANLFDTNDREELKMANRARRMHYCDGPLDVALLLIWHPDLNRYELETNERVYRGMTVSPSVKEQYPLGKRIVNKTFISASKSIDVAKSFLGKQIGQTSCLFIINLIKNQQRTALNISSLSAFPEEEEVLILPFTAFEICYVEEISGQSNDINFIIEMKEINLNQDED